MDKETATNILQDYTDIMAIQRLILKYYKLNTDERALRGEVHRKVASDLDMTINPRFYSLFNRVTSQLNLKKIKVQGIAHYKGLTPRNNV